MNNTVTVAAVMASALLAAPAQADRTYFFAPMAGFNTGGTLSVTDRLPEEDNDRVKIGEMKVDSSESFGLMLGVETYHPGNVYLLVNRQSTEFESGSYAGLGGQGVTLDYYHLGGSLFFPRGNFEPYVTASVGVTYFNPDELSSDTRGSMGFGVGARYMLFKNLAVYADIRGFATFFSDNNEIFCGGEEGCKIRLEGESLLQGQANAGLMIRF
ncbi:outer membrane beta-barrel protein [Ferrimonas marina]|uniref:Outer membrane protein W n=1 Tax=Ferrimonas marina TaxID=299255 RepID=A0A1M5ZKP6_9GAMM|nr:outer membrane beta-barrel protein [Ferrimonas marina]SHI24877.1 Outer membrane protein W [Ferrimonas marina]